MGGQVVWFMVGVRGSGLSFYGLGLGVRGVS